MVVSGRFYEKRPHAVVIVAPRIGGRRYAGTALLRNREGQTLVAFRETLPAEDPTTATLMMVWRLLREAQRHRMSRLAVHLSDVKAARILSRQEDAPLGLARWYFAAKAACNRLGQVRFRVLDPRHYERLKAIAERAREDKEARPLALFADGETGRNAA